MKRAGEDSLISGVASARPALAILRIPFYLGVDTLDVIRVPMQE